MNPFSLGRIAAQYKKIVGDQKAALRQFIWAAVIFFIGMASVLGSNIYLSDPLHQEILRLLGIVVAIPTFFIAMSAYLCYIIARFRSL